MTATIVTAHRAGLSELVAGVRSAVLRHDDWDQTAVAVADVLREHRPGPDILTLEEQRGDPRKLTSYRLYVEPDGSFSIIALVLRPGQATTIHDHITWCAFGVIQGMEHEELFDSELNVIGQADNVTGDVSGFAPPGDIHRVRSTGTDTAISVHIYGTDVTRIGSSVRRVYPEPEDRS